MTGAFWGADASELEQLANAVRAAASELEGIVGSLGAALASTTWQGPDAEVFQSDWHGIHARALGTTVEALRSAASKLDFEVRQQLTASGATSGGGISVAAIGGSLAGVGATLSAGGLFGAGILRGIGLPSGPVWSGVLGITSGIGHVFSGYSLVDEGVGVASSVDKSMAGIAAGFDDLAPAFGVAGGIFSAFNLVTSDGPTFVNDLMTRPMSGATIDAGVKSYADGLGIAAGVVGVLPPPADAAAVPLGLAAGAIDLTVWADPQIGNQAME